MKQRQHPRRDTRADRPSPGRGGHRKPAPPAAGANLLLYGLHAVEAALRNPRRAILGLTATRAAAERLGAAISARGIEPRMAENRDIAELLPIAVYVRPGNTRKATASPAATTLARYRIDETDAALLPDLEPPAWVFLNGIMSGLSSSAIRAEKTNSTR